MHKQQGWRQAWEYCQAKPMQTLGITSQGVDWSWSQCIKSHHAQTSLGKGLPNHFWNRNTRSILPGLRRKYTVEGMLLSGPKSSFQIKVILHFIWKSRSRAEGGKLRPAGHIRPAEHFHPAREGVKKKMLHLSNGFGSELLIWCNIRERHLMAV